MSNTFGAIEVIHKPTGERRLIKFDRFNPEIHKQLGDPFTMDRKYDYNKPIDVQLDPIANAVYDGEKRRERAQKEQEEKIVEKQEEIVETIEETSNDLVLTIEEIEKLSWPQLKSYAKRNLDNFDPKFKKVDLIAQLRIKLNPNSL